MTIAFSVCITVITATSRYAYALVRERLTTQDRKNAQEQPHPIQEIGKGKPGPGRGHKTGYNITRLRGDSADYLTDRIARDDIDILDRMKAGEYKSRGRGRWPDAAPLIRCTTIFFSRGADIILTPPGD